MEKNDWGLQLGNLTLEDSFISDFDSSESVDEYENVIFGKKISFPLKFLYQVIFVGAFRIEWDRVYSTISE